MSNLAKKLQLESGDPDLQDLTLENRRILVVEDEPQITEAYVDILSQRKSLTPSIRSSRSPKPAPLAVVDGLTRRPPPFEVTICSTPNEAISKIREAVQNNKPYTMGFFDVLLKDKIDGIELVRQVFEIDSRMFAVFVTAYQDRSVDSIHEILGEHNAERWDYLNKPFSEGEIVQKARNLVTLWNLKQDRVKKTEQLADATRRLIASDRASSVAAVARSVGHEFGNILLQISGTAELNQNSSPEKMSKALKTILNASDTASRILEKFKDLSRPADHNAEQKMESVTSVVNEAHQLMEHQFEKSKIRFCIIKNDKVTAYLSRTSMVQVLVNMFINAVHAMPHGGQIDVSIESIGEKLVLKVHDYGPGIPDEIMTKVFDPFFTTKGEEGTGLGLSICREIVEIEHGGAISVRNHSSKGAEFTIEIPLERKDDE